MAVHEYRVRRAIRYFVTEYVESDDGQEASSTEICGLSTIGQANAVAALYHQEHPGSTVSLAEPSDEAKARAIKAAQHFEE